MSPANHVRRPVWRVLCAAALLQCAQDAFGSDTYDAGVLTMPLLTIGNANYENVTLTVDRIVSGPTGVSAHGTVDSYDPTTGYLTVQSVMAVGKTYYNVVATVKRLVSIGSLSGADTYLNGVLSVAFVRVINGSLYANASVTAEVINSVGGQLPRYVQDVFDPASHQLTIAAVEYNGNVFTNVNITVEAATVAGPGAIVPNVVGDARTAAIAAINGAGLTVGAVTTQSSTTVPAGAIISASVAAGTEVVAGTAVDLVVSSGAPVEYAFFSAPSSNQLYSYSVGASAALTQISALTTGNFPNSIAVDSGCRHLYVQNHGDNTISAFAIDNGGALTAISTTGALSDTLWEIALDSAGHYLYGSAGSLIYQFDMGADGGLSLQGASSATAAYMLRPSPVGPYVYFTTLASNGLLGYSEGGTGVLSPVPGFPVSIGAADSGIEIAITPSGKYLFTPSGSSGNVYGYVINADGTLTANGSVTAQGGLWGIAVDPTGRFLYTTGVATSVPPVIYAYSIAMTGALTLIGTFPTNGAKAQIVVDPSGQYLFVPGNPIYLIGADGSLRASNSPDVGETAVCRK